MLIEWKRNQYLDYINYLYFMFKAKIVNNFIIYFNQNIFEETNFGIKLDKDIYFLE